MEGAHFFPKPWWPTTQLQGVITYRTTALIVEWLLVINSLSNRRKATGTFVITNFAWTAMELNLELHSDTHLSHCGCVMVPNSLVVLYQHTRQMACVTTPKTTYWISTSINIHVSQMFVCVTCTICGTTLPVVCPPYKWQSQMDIQHYCFRTLYLLTMVSRAQARLNLLEERVKLQFLIDWAWVRAAANSRVCSACLASRRSKWILWSLGPMADIQSCPQHMKVIKLDS
jgi:hypothetical protein